MECFGTTDFDNDSRLITLSAIIISGLHCIYTLIHRWVSQPKPCTRLTPPPPSQLHAFPNSFFLILSHENGMLLITFVEIRVVSGRSRKRAGCPHEVSGRTMLRHVRAALCCSLDNSLSERHSRGTAWARHGMCERNTAALCKSNGKEAI
jgi:hypothetical protein